MSSEDHSDPETIDIIDSDRPDSGEVVDLTSEVAETSVVDLTNNDSVVLVDEGLQSDADDSPRAFRPRLFPSPHRNTSSRSKPGVVSCPICFDTYPEILHSGRVMVSTLCGHTFCSQCLRDSLAHAHTCPTCRKKLTHRQYHPIYI
ncbi:RING finger protein 4 [Clupea harengus]|uniref:RING finger protein 4 n=1 Tax=Clupea harengus TaxID=7950 RepID=A0A6P8GZB3_CLUHA|nr:RING finger protein 4 [Clupea harengus]XP_031443366.1 RING finger protein 4 [Clupea harengus]